MKRYCIFALTIFLLAGCANKSHSFAKNDSSNFANDSDNSSYVAESGSSNYVIEGDNNSNVAKAYKTPETATSTSKTYNVGGKMYYPKNSVPIGWKEKGIASWYGPNFHGRYTSSGELYNMNSYTAAHKTLPMGTIVKVTNLKNNKSVAVKINDRGPFVKGRIIDLSYIAGKKIGLDKTGLAPVVIEVIGFDGKNYTNKYGVQKNKKNTNKSEATHTIIETVEYRDKSYASRYTIQVGSFIKEKGAMLTVDKYKKLGYNPKILKKGNFYKVVIGDFKSYDEAKRFKLENNLNGFVMEE